MVLYPLVLGWTGYSLVHVGTYIRPHFYVEADS